MPLRPDVVSRYSGFRPEVQGLRAIAVLMVVIYHVFIGRVSGGVDIFLLISAFFMTSSFVRRLEGGKPLAIARYWLHTFKRLLPLAVITILLTSLVLTFWYPQRAKWTYREDALPPVFYVENWHLAAVQADYYAANRSLASPFQHFWSLSVQGQVFLIWPLVFGLCYLICRRFGWQPVRVLAVGFGLIFAGSLAFSIHLTAADQGLAYFNTWARLWEFALGSLLALAIPFIKPAVSPRLLLGWLGLAGMISCGIVLDVQGVFPGWIALWPLGSAAAIMIAGQSGSRFGVDRLLSWTPVQRLGDCAYALYIVHWPILTTYRALSGELDVAFFPGTLVVLGSIGVAMAATRFIDEPLRRWRWADSSTAHMAVMVAASLTIAAVPISSWNAFESWRLRLETEQARVEFVRNNPGARSLMDDFVYEGDPGAPVLPQVGELDEQWAGLPEWCTGRFAPRADLVAGGCAQTETLESPSRTVVLVGNSHTEQLLEMLLPIAEERNWQLVSLLQPGCGTGINGFDECAQTNRAFLDYLLELAPDAVITTSTRSRVADPGGERIPAGFARFVEPLVERGIAVVGVRDNPRFEIPPVDCWLAQHDLLDSCTIALDELLTAHNPADDLVETMPGFMSLDLADLYCPDGQCSPVIGNVLVWMDQDHVTKDYSLTMAEPARERLVAVVEEPSF